MPTTLTRRVWRSTYYRSDRLLVLRDDGIGMTEEEFNQRWLTIGTESKLQARAVPTTPSARKYTSATDVRGERHRPGWQSPRSLPRCLF